MRHRDNVVCSSNGNCIKGEDDKWSCRCFSATGRYCHHCLDDYEIIDGKCMPENCIDDDVECSGHGACIINETGALCFCGDNRDAKTACSTCLDHFTNVFGICVSDNCIFEGKICNNAGKCDIINEDLQLHGCTCDDGYHGNTCGLCMPGYDVVGDKCFKPICVTGTR